MFIFMGGVWFLHKKGLLKLSYFLTMAGHLPVFNIRGGELLITSPPTLTHSYQSLSGGITVLPSLGLSEESVI